MRSVPTLGAHARRDVQLGRRDNTLTAVAAQFCIAVTWECGWGYEPNSKNLYNNKINDSNQ